MSTDIFLATCIFIIISSIYLHNTISLLISSGLIVVCIYGLHTLKK